MAYYTFETIETGEEFTLEMSFAERNAYVEANPQVRQLITAAATVHDIGGIKKDNGWTDMLGRIKRANRGSTINTGNLGEI